MYIPYHWQVEIDKILEMGVGAFKHTGRRTWWCRLGMPRLGRRFCTWQYQQCYHQVHNCRNKFAGKGIYQLSCNWPFRIRPHTYQPMRLGCSDRFQRNFYQNIFFKNYRSNMSLLVIYSLHNGNLIFVHRSHFIVPAGDSRRPVLRLRIRARLPSNVLPEIFETVYTHIIKQEFNNDI